MSARMTYGLGLNEAGAYTGDDIASFIASLGYAGSTAGALFDLGRYWLPSTTDPTKPVEVTQDDWFAQFTCADTSGIRQYQDKDGLLKYATGMTNKPVFDYSQGRKALRNDYGLNYLTYNQDFNNAVWKAYTAKPSDLAKNAISPTGAENDAWSFTKAGAGGGTAGLVYEIGGTGTLAYNVGVWLKADAPTIMRLGVNDAYTIPINVTTSWVFYSYSAYLANNSTAVLSTRRFQLYFNTSDNTGLSSSSKVYIYAPFADISGRLASSSILTTSTGVNLPTTTNRIPARAEALLSNPYTLLMDFSGNYVKAVNVALMQLNSITHISTPTPYSSQWVLQPSNTIFGNNSDLPTKIAYGGDANGRKVSCNGGAVVSNATSAIPSINKLVLTAVMTHSYRFILFPSLLSDAQLQALST